MKLRIARDLDLPLDIVTQAIAILARKGAGKTYTASVIVEEVVRAKVPVVVLDPTGAWWGLRTSADGQKPGLPVVIFGGDHGDVPLEPTAGTVIADVVIDHPGAYVVDLSAFPSKASEQRFAADFLERLYRAKKPDTGPLLLVVDEADFFAPQQPRDRGDQIRTLGALESIVRRGRIKGLGDLLITQRAAVLNKNVLTQTEVLIVMQTTGPQDIAAVKEWVTVNATKEEAEDFVKSLPPMQRGEAWVWSPSFLGVLQRVRIRERTTFDSSRTPTAGENVVAPRAFAQVDLEQLGERITATIEKAKADDPRELRRRIVELERAAKAAQDVSAPVSEVRIERIEVPVLNGQVEQLGEYLVDLRQYGDSLVRAGDGLREVALSITAAIDRVSATPRSAPHVIPAAVASVQGGPSTLGPSGNLAGRTGAPLERQAASSGGSPDRHDGGAPGSMGKAERLILQALAAYPQPLTREQLAFLAGYHPRSKGFTNALGVLRSREFITPGFPAEATQAGRIAEPVGDPVDLVDLVEYWMGRFGRAERAILGELLAVYPASSTRDVLAAAAGFEHVRSKGFTNALGRLRGLGLVDGTTLSESFARLVGR